MERKIDIDDLELDAVELFIGHMTVRDIFLELTDRGHVNLKTDPMEEKFVWEDRGQPTDKDIELDAALRIFLDMGYISKIVNQGTAHFSAIAAEKAEKIRVIYDQLPINLKNKIFDKATQLE